MQIDFFFYPFVPNVHMQLWALRPIYFLENTFQGEDSPWLTVSFMYELEKRGFLAFIVRLYAITPWPGTGICAEFPFVDIATWDGTKMLPVLTLLTALFKCLYIIMQLSEASEYVLQTALLHNPTQNQQPTSPFLTRLDLISSWNNIKHDVVVLRSFSYTLSGRQLWWDYSSVLCICTIYQ